MLVSRRMNVDLPQPESAATPITTTFFFPQTYRRFRCSGDKKRASKSECHGCLWFRKHYTTDSYRQQYSVEIVNNRGLTHHCDRTTVNTTVSYGQHSSVRAMAPTWPRSVQLKHKEQLITIHYIMKCPEPRVNVVDAHLFTQYRSNYHILLLYYRLRNTRHVDICRSLEFNPPVIFIHTNCTS